MRSTRTAAGIALAAMLASGCVRGRARYGAYAGEAVLTGLGFVLVSQVEPDDQDPDDMINDAGFRRNVIRLGWLMVAAGAFGFLTTFAVQADDEPESPKPTFDPADLPPLPVVPTADPVAVRLTQQARRAAVARQCIAVVQLAPRVKLADRAYFRAVFETDPAIASCL